MTLRSTTALLLFAGLAGACGDPGASFVRAVRPVVGVDGACTLVRDTEGEESAPSEGRLHCWGDAAARAQPRPDVSPDRLRELAVGNPSCAVQASTERLVCWGANESGQIGDGTTAGRPRATPVRDVGVPLRAPRVSRFAERGFACATGDDDVLRCWGAGGRGQLGDGTLGDRPFPRPVRGVEVDGMLRALDGDTLTLGAAHACAALRGAPGLACWGAGEEGQLAAGAFDDAEVPVLVQLPGVDEEGALVPAEETTEPVFVASVAAGRAHSCAVVLLPVAGPVEPAVLCWGDDAFGQLGDGSPGPPSRTPRFVRGLEPRSELMTRQRGLAPALAAGRDHTCVVLRAGGPGSVAGEVWCWGASGEQQTGLRLGADVPREAVNVALPDGFAPVPGSAPSLGRAHGCLELFASSTTGLVERRFACWGGNARGQLGDGTTLGSRFPRRVLGLPNAPRRP